MPSESKSVNLDRLDFCVNVESFWLLFVRVKKIKYFYVIDSILQKGLGGPHVSASSFDWFHGLSVSLHDNWPE